MWTGTDGIEETKLACERGSMEPPMSTTISTDSRSSLI